MRQLSIQLSDFAFAVLNAEANRQDVPVEELLAHAAMYYLADLDSDRLATQAVRFPAID